ncbi:MAG: GNAT family N-acetyltransferase [Ignavibacteriales bacterium]
MKIVIHQLREYDLAEADRIFRLAFGTFFGLPDPMTFAGDADYVRTRYYADPASAYGATIVNNNGGGTGDGNDNGRLVGSNFTANWGSVGFFGPLTVHPDYWDKGVARSLMEPTIQLFSKWNTKHSGLFTFAQSPKHISLYQKYGFWPHFLTAVMSKAVSPNNANGINNESLQWSKYSDVSKMEKESDEYLLNGCRGLTTAIYDGLDLRVEIMSVIKQRLGDIVLIWDPDSTNNTTGNNRDITGFAICHCGKGTEAGSDTCYIKFAAVRPPTSDNNALLAANNFDRLIDACTIFALQQGLSRLVAGVNTSRRKAYRKMLSKGFRIDMLGVVMQNGADVGYDRPDVYIMDDWR